MLTLLFANLNIFFVIMLSLVMAGYSSLQNITLFLLFNVIKTPQVKYVVVKVPNRLLYTKAHTYTHTWEYWFHRKGLENTCVNIIEIAFPEGVCVLFGDWFKRKQHFSHIFFASLSLCLLDWIGFNYMCALNVKW